MDTTTETMTASQAAKCLGVSRRRVVQFIRDGRLSAIQDAWGYFHVPAAEVESLAAVPRAPGRPSAKKF